ncbi:MAG: hypothetical protein WC821_00855 [archaeon]|jgi:hypothetical protein
MKNTIVGSQIRALAQAKKARFEKALAVEKKAKRIALKRRATQKQKTEAVISALRTQQAFLSTLNAEIRRIRVIMKRVNENSARISPALKEKRLLKFRRLIAEKKMKKIVTKSQIERFKKNILSKLE